MTPGPPRSSSNCKPSPGVSSGHVPPAAAAAAAGHPARRCLWSTLLPRGNSNSGSSSSKNGSGNNGPIQMNPLRSRVALAIRGCSRSRSRSRSSCIPSRRSFRPGRLPTRRATCSLASLCVPTLTTRTTIFFALATWRFFGISCSKKRIHYWIYRPLSPLAVAAVVAVSAVSGVARPRRDRRISMAVGHPPKQSTRRVSTFRHYAYAAPS